MRRNRHARFMLRPYDALQRVRRDRRRALLRRRPKNPMGLSETTPEIGENADKQVGFRRKLPFSNAGVYHRSFRPRVPIVAAAPIAPRA